MRYALWNNALECVIYSSMMLLNIKEHFFLKTDLELILLAGVMKITF